MRCAWVPFAVGWVGCEAKYGTVDQTPEFSGEALEPDEPEFFDAGPVTVCERPQSGFDRFTLSGRQRGISGPFDNDERLRSCMAMPGGVTAHDLNGDGYPEVSVHQQDRFPFVYCNRQDGTFESCVVGPTWTDERGLRAHGWADVNGDRRPDLLAAGLGVFAVSRNEGDGRFSPFEIVWEQSGWPKTCILTFAWGDLDGDHDLDVVLPGADAIPAEGSIPMDDHAMDGADVHVLYGDGAGGFEDGGVLTPATNPTLSVFVAVTDRDLDGDQDVLVASDRVEMGDFRTAFFRNDGGVLTDDAPAVGANVPINGMGLGQADINQDGLPDYCMSDVGPTLTCLMSDAARGYYNGGAALGLSHDFEANPILPDETTEADFAFLRTQWSPWSVELADFDNDAHPDAVTVAGVPPERGSVVNAVVSQFQPDALWQGGADGFVERTVEAGFGNFGMNQRYGLTTADLDRDGHLDIVTAGFNVEPEIWTNPCGDGAWLQVDFAGPPGNTQGFGATVTVKADGTAHQQQLHGLRTAGQGPAVLHFGLGTAIRARIEVLWPGGERTALNVDQLNRRVTARYPNR